MDLLFHTVDVHFHRSDLTFLERFREEERQLLAIKEMLIIFEKQLEYVRLPIAEAVTDMAKKAGAPFEDPLMEFTEKILFQRKM